jgi:hypothetical protein
MPVTPDQDRRSRSLYRRRPGAVSGQLVVVATEGDLFAAKQAVEHFDGLGQPCHARRAIVEADPC